MTKHHMLRGGNTTFPSDLTDIEVVHIQR